MLKKIKDRLDSNRFLLVITIVLFVAMYIAGVMVFKDKNFGKPQVFFNLFINNAGLIVAAVGMTMVLITGGIDISIGSVIGMTCMLLAWMMEIKGMSAGTAIVIVLIVGSVFGLVQGFFIAYLKIQPFIVTLAGMFFARGMTAIISSDMISITNSTFLSIANKKMYLPFLATTNKKGVVV